MTHGYGISSFFTLRSGFFGAIDYKRLNGCFGPIAVVLYTLQPLSGVESVRYYTH